MDFDPPGPHNERDLELLARGHENYIEAFRRVAHALPAGTVEEDGDCVYIRTGLPGPGFNR